MSAGQRTRWYTANGNASAGSAATILAAGAAMKGLQLWNLSPSNVMLFTFDGTTPTATHGMPVQPGSGYEFFPSQIPVDEVQVYCAAADPYEVIYS